MGNSHVRVHLVIIIQASRTLRAGVQRGRHSPVTTCARSVWFWHPGDDGPVAVEATPRQLAVMLRPPVDPATSAPRQLAVVLRNPVDPATSALLLSRAVKRLAALAPATCLSLALRLDRPGSTASDLRARHHLAAESNNYDTSARCQPCD